MNKSEFLNELEIYLMHLPKTERDEIIFDYSEHFRLGLEDGKTESEIAKSLGEPSTIAKQYYINDKSQSSFINTNYDNNRRTKYILIGFGALVILFAAIFSFSVQSGHNNKALNMGKTESSLSNSVTNMTDDIVSSALEFANDIQSDTLSNVDKIISSIPNIVVNENNLSNSDYKEFKVDENQNISLSTTNLININTSSYSINVLRSDAKEVGVHFYGSGYVNNEEAIPKLTVDTTGSTLNIKADKKSNINANFKNSDLKLEVSIPSSFNYDIRVNSSSGSINFDKLSFNNIECNSNSGSINLKELNLAEIKCTTNSGKINCINSNIKNAFFNSNSGSKSITGFSGNLYSSSASGTLNAEFAQFEGNEIDISSNSGSVSLIVPNNSGYYLKAVTNSGKINCHAFTEIVNNQSNFVEGIVKNNRNKINIKTSSGSITIK